MTIVRDGFLIFLMSVAGALVAGYIVLVITMVRRDAEADGCLLWITGVIVAGIVTAIIATVGHAVGVDVSSLTR
jgi:hypothetical protein